MDNKLELYLGYLLLEEQNDIKTNIITEEMTTTFNKDIEIWNKEFLNNLHCSIRYQGNFIMKTLDDMKYYVSQLQSNPTDPQTEYFPGNILHSDDNPSNKILRIKFVMFTNIRLDFSPNYEHPGYKYYIPLKKGSKEPESVIVQRNENLKAAYIRSIAFSNSINPLSKDRGTTTIQKPKVITPMPNPNPFIMSKIKTAFGKRRKHHSVKHHKRRHSTKYVKKLKKDIKFLKSIKI
jgi:hypothetical protein